MVSDLKFYAPRIAISDLYFIKGILFINNKINEGNNMAYIPHRKINQPNSGRRLLECSRNQGVLHDPDRRYGEERRSLADRRKSIH